MRYYNLRQPKTNTVFRYLVPFFFLWYDSTQIQVKSCVESYNQQPLIDVLSYVITRLHRDLYDCAHIDIPVKHKIVVDVINDAELKQFVCHKLNNYINNNKK